MTQDATAILLLTRPLEAAHRFADRVAALNLPGLAPCIAPLLRIERTGTPIDWQDAGAVIFTSRNGVEAGSAQDPRRVPCHCVGAATAGAARDAGWPVLSVSPDANALVAALTAAPPAASGLLHIAGAARRGAIAERLTRAGLPTRVHVAYDQALQPLAAPALAALSGSLPVIAPLFSPRTARHFAQLHRGTAPLWLPALSVAVAEPLASLAHATVLVAQRPDAVAMLDATKEMYQAATRVEGSGDDD